MDRIRRATAKGIVCAATVLFCASAVSGVEFAGGTGQPNDPYQIATAEQLIGIGSDSSLLDKHFVLVKDIDLDPNLPGGQAFPRSLISPCGPKPQLRPPSKPPELDYGSFTGAVSKTSSECVGECPMNISGCLWDTDLSGTAQAVGNRPADTASVAGLPTSQMQTAAPFLAAGWDFAEVWTICEGVDYPRLRWEGVECED